MFKIMMSLVLLIVATAFETNGDALIRKAIFDYDGLSLTRGLIIAGSAVLLLGYALLLNFAPLPFGKVVGLYIATLFVVWQVTAYIQFRLVPSPSVLVGGAMIVAGGLIVSFLNNAEAGH